MKIPDRGVVGVSFFKKTSRIFAFCLPTDVPSLGDKEEEVGLYKRRLMPSPRAVEESRRALNTQLEQPACGPGSRPGCESESRSVLSCSLRPHGLYSPWNSPGQNTRVGSLSLLQGIFPTQGLYPGLPHCRQIPYQLSHKRSPAEGARKARTGWLQILKPERESVEKLWLKIRRDWDTENELFLTCHVGLRVQVKLPSCHSEIPKPLKTESLSFPPKFLAQKLSEWWSLTRINNK